MPEVADIGGRADLHKNNWQSLFFRWTDWM